MPKQESVREPRREKVAEVNELADLLSKCNLVVLTDYRGLTVSDMASLRRKLREQGVQYHVAKNTLTGFAAEKVGKGTLKESLTGPTAIAFAMGDEAAAAKALADFERGSKVFKIKSAMLGDKMLKPSDVGAIASLPPRNVLLGQVVSGMQAPIAGVVGVLGGVLTGLVGTLDARRRQLEEQGAA